MGKINSYKISLIFIYFSHLHSFGVATTRGKRYDIRATFDKEHQHMGARNKNKQ
jgi:hypothetical protein